ncbi:MAG: hypothetical protein AAGA37_19920 [Actinomycetota bacterium]
MYIYLAVGVVIFFLVLCLAMSLGCVVVAVLDDQRRGRNLDALNRRTDIIRTGQAPADDTPQ